jgi:hypothetical protein
MNKRPRDLGAPQFGGRDSRFRHPSLCPRDCVDTSRGLANNPVVPEPLMGCAIFIRSDGDELSFAVVRTGFGPPNPARSAHIGRRVHEMGISRGCAGHRFRNRLPSVLHRMQISSVTRPLPRLSSRRVNAPAPSVAPPGGGFSLRNSRGFPMTRSTGFGLFAIIAALLAYVASLSFLSS